MGLLVEVFVECCVVGGGGAHGMSLWYAYVRMFSVYSVMVKLSGVLPLGVPESSVGSWLSSIFLSPFLSVLLSSLTATVVTSCLIVRLLHLSPNRVSHCGGKVGYNQAMEHGRHSFAVEETLSESQMSSLTLVLSDTCSLKVLISTCQNESLA